MNEKKETEDSPSILETNRRSRIEVRTVHFIFFFTVLSYENAVCLSNVSSSSGDTLQQTRMQDKNPSANRRWGNNN